MPAISRSSDILHATRPTDAVRGAADLLRRLWVLLSTWCGRAAQRRALAALDHRLLRDVGLTRDQAVVESEKPFWRA